METPVPPPTLKEKSQHPNSSRIEIDEFMTVPPVNQIKETP